MEIAKYLPNENTRRINSVNLAYIRVIHDFKELQEPTYINA
jgi:hypothetical protein